MNEFIEGIGCTTPAIARQALNYLGDKGRARQRAGLERTVDPERQYQDLSVYEAPGALPAWIPDP